MIKSCPRCSDTNPAHFGVNRNRADNMALLCRSCTSEAAKRHRRKASASEIKRLAALDYWFDTYMDAPKPRVMDAKPKATPEARIIQALKDRALSWREIEAEAGLREQDMDEAMGEMLESGALRERHGVYSIGAHER